MQKIPTVLLIDDNEDDNEFHEIVIKAAESQVKVKSTTQPLLALNCWQKGCGRANDEGHPLPNLVFLDINMPRLNGFELLEKIRTSPDPNHRIEETKVFILSTSSNPYDHKKAMTEYGDLVKGFVTKPLTGKIFHEILEKHFQAA